MFTLARARRHAALLVALALTAGIVTATAGTIQNTVGDAGRTGVRDALAQLPSENLALRLSMPASDEARDADVDDALAAALAGLPFDVERSAETRLDIRGRGRVVLASIPGVPGAAADDALELVEGTWPEGDAQTALQADAAASLGLAIGDPVPLGEETATVTGTWRVRDPHDPRWLGDSVWTTGIGLDLRGPFLIPEDAWPSTGLTPTARWTVVPDIARITGDDLGRFRAGWDALPGELEDRDILAGTRRGGFLQSARTTGARYAALQASIPISLTAFAGVAALAWWEFGGLFARARADEDRMLWARGTTRRRIALRAGVIAAVVAAVGAGVAAVVTGAVGWAIAAAVVPGLAFAARTRVPAHESADRGGRTRRTAGVAAVAALATTALVATWQLLTQGLLTRTDGATGVDPVSVLAPGAVLLTVVVLGFALLPVAVRRPGRTAGLGARRGIVRRAGLVATSVIAVGLAVGQFAVAAGFAQTWRESFTQTQEMHAGTALRITDPGGLTDEAVSIAATTGAVAPVRNDSATVGGESVEVVAVAPDALAQLGAVPDSATLARALTAALPELPAGAGVVMAEADGGVPARLRLSDGFGRVVTLELVPGMPAAVPFTEHGPWRITAVDVTPDAAASAVQLTRVTTDAGDVSLDGTWTGTSFPGGPYAPAGPAAPSDLPVAEVFPGDGVARVVPVPPSTAVVTASVADVAGVDEGDVFSLDYGGPRPVVANTIAAAVPGSERADALLIDLWSVEAVMLIERESIPPPRTAWIDAPPSAAPALREALPEVRVRTAADDPDQRMLAAGPAALWIAAAGTGLLALAALAASSAALRSLRREEVAILRALGVRARDQVALRHRELALVTGWGALAGLIGGAAVVLLTAGTIARAGVPDPYPAIPTEVRVDLLSVAIALAALAVGVAIVAFGYGRAVARQAREARP